MKKNKDNSDNIPGLDPESVIAKAEQVASDPSQALVLKTEPINEVIRRAMSQPTPKKLFGSFWREGEICFLFANTGVGKSSLAIQIADLITRGENKSPFDVEVDPQVVLYCDFELSGIQLKMRYSQDEEIHKFSHRLHWASMDMDSVEIDDFDSVEDAVVSDIEREAVRLRATVVIVDNITYLKSDTEKAKDALPLMKQLKRIQRANNLSMMIIGHTPKIKENEPLSINNMMGSKMLINFCDSAFAIGRSISDKSIRYMIQMKTRSSMPEYERDNVMVCELSKTGPLLGFTFSHLASESSMLIQEDDLERQNNIARAKQLNSEGLSVRNIAKEIGKGSTTIQRYLKE